MRLTTARKHHRCEICDFAITPGERYVNVRYAPWESIDCEVYWGVKACRFCWEHSEGKWDYYETGEGWTISDLRDTLNFHIIDRILTPAWQAGLLEGHENWHYRQVDWWKMLEDLRREPALV